MPPPGAHLSLDELIAALKWKLEDEGDESNTIETGGPSDLKWASWASTWSQRVGELRYITSLVAYRQNAGVGVNLLPDEILGEIFMQVQGEYANTSFRLPPEEPDLTGANEWIKVGHVCQKWRRTAQNTKALWSRIILGPSLPSPATMATHFFHQSHPLPISLEQNIGRLSGEEGTAMHKFYNLLLQHPNRVSALYLRHFQETAWYLLQQLLPNLVELELSSRDYEIGNIANFLGGSPSSSLRKLFLDKYAWPGVTPPALTHLYLTDNGHGVSLAGFFDILASVSPTLQALYVVNAGPKALDSEERDSLSMAERLVMPVLEHFEVLASLYHRGANSLSHLYKLSLPNVQTIIWDSHWTADLRKDTDVHERKAMIPPYEHLARVTRLVGWAARKERYALQGESLYFDPRNTTMSALEAWMRLLPNLTVLAVPDCATWDRMNQAIVRLKSLTHLHVAQTSGYIHLVHSLCECLSQVKRSFAGMELEPLSEPILPGYKSITRARDHLQATYMLCFEAAAIDGLFLTDPSP
ncbi:hypothetical protein GALMADRAFT_1131969 [Galerina marginata CBS 339.88]|uniref:F-box domain-containing protein n=1 Tax=Galerina marginata (strain CBS 339.88) TaxID=685588 RepID=A0A067SGZ7_GALM3|nr:hypothetical protein GALMADRAFT_1131969 [Galerina marginata CBS 339.88]